MTTRPWHVLDRPLTEGQRSRALATYQTLPLRGVRQDVVVVPGGLRAVCEVQGVPVSTFSPAEQEGFLSGWAAFINAVRPTGAQFVARARDGGLDAEVKARRLAGPGMAIAPYRAMALASANHLESLMHQGDARALEFLLVVPGKTATEVDRAIETYGNLLGQIGVGLRRVVEPELTLRLASVTRPDVPSHWYLSLGEATLYVSPEGAGVEPGPVARRLTRKGWVPK